jgi:hypothetical protein
MKKSMTKGLLMSRLTKLSLEKQHAKNPSGILWNKFKTFRNVSNLTIRAHIKMLFNSSELENNAKELEKKLGLF